MPNVRLTSLFRWTRVLEPMVPRNSKELPKERLLAQYRVAHFVLKEQTRQIFFAEIE